MTSLPNARAGSLAHIFVSTVGNTEIIYEYGNIQPGKMKEH